MPWRGSIVCCALVYAIPVPTRPPSLLPCRSRGVCGDAQTRLLCEGIIEDKRACAWTKNIFGSDECRADVSTTTGIEC